MKSYILLLFLVSINLGCSQKKLKAITEVSHEEMKKVVLIDVRTPEEFNAGHLPNAININWYDGNFQQQIEHVVTKDKPAYVYCKVGGRSAMAAKKLEALGYNVTDLSGGYDAYKLAEQK